MAQLAIPVTTRVVGRLVRGSEEIVNVWHVKSAAEPDAAQGAAIRDAFWNFYAGLSTAAVGIRGIRSFLDTSVTVSSVTSQFIGQTPYDDPVEFPSDNPAGTLAGDVLPLQTALVVSLRTGIATRSGRGRIFLGGFGESTSEEATDGNPRPTAALITAVVNALTDLDNAIDLVGGGADIAVASQTLAASRPVTSMRVKNVWSTQRRRAKSVPITATSIVTV